MVPPLPMENITNLSIQNNNNKKAKLSVRETVIFAMLGALMYCSKFIMEMLPNIHLLGMFTMTFTVVYRKRALYPIYIYVLINGFFAGFASWWIPYLYIWTVLWGVTMLLPENISPTCACIVYPIICCLHGLLFGTLYAPAQALLFGLDFRQTVAWVLSGLPFDAIHGISNLFAGMLVLPLSTFMKKHLVKSRA